MARFSRRYYKTVSASSSDQDDYNLPSGDKLYICFLGGNSVYSQDVKVEIIEDPAGTPIIHLSTHGDADQDTEGSIEIIGPKTIRIKLTNDSNQSETIGGFYLGELYV